MPHNTHQAVIARALACCWIVSCGLFEPTASAEGQESLPGSAVASDNTPAEALDSGERTLGAGISRPLQAAPVFVPEVLWRFRAAAPSSGPPAVSSLGQVYLSTVEGYVHALAADGAFRWSYAVLGLPQGGPLVGKNGRVYLTTNAGRVYALQADGRPAWVKRSRARISSPPVFASESSLLYNSVKGMVRSVSLSGGAAWSRRLGERLSTPPTPLYGGGAAVVSAGNKLWWLRRSRRVRSVQLPAPVDFPPIAAQGLLLAIAGGQLLAYESSSRQLRWQVAATRAASNASGELLVAVQQGELIWLDLDKGETQWRVALPGRASAAPLVLDNGVVALPLVSGQLFVAAPRTDESALVAISKAPLRSPVSAGVLGQGLTKGRVAIASGNGQLVMIDLGNWPKSANGRPLYGPLDTP